MLAELLNRKIGRIPFWVVFLVNFYAVGALKERIPQLDNTGDLVGLLVPLLFIPAFVVAVWRLHDIGRDAKIVAWSFGSNLLAGALVPWGNDIWLHYDPSAAHAAFFNPPNILIMALNLITFRMLALCSRPSADGWQPRVRAEAEEMQPDLLPSAAPVVIPAPRATPTRIYAPMAPSASRKSFGRRA